jgi:hypothetical protein
MTATPWSDGTYMGSIRQDGWNQQGTTITTPSSFNYCKQA